MNEIHINQHLMYSGIPFFGLVYPIFEKNIIPDQMVSHKALIRIHIVIHCTLKHMLITGMLQVNRIKSGPSVVHKIIQHDKG